MVTHLDLSHNRLRCLPPALAALRCLEVKRSFLPCHPRWSPSFPTARLMSLPTLQRDVQNLPASHPQVATCLHCFQPPDPMSHKLITLGSSMATSCFPTLRCCRPMIMPLSPWMASPTCPGCMSCYCVTTVSFLCVGPLHWASPLEGQTAGAGRGALTEPALGELIAMRPSLAGHHREVGV